MPRPQKVHRASGRTDRIMDMSVIKPLRPLKDAVRRSGKPVIESRLQDLVVITGYSGAGKSTAMNVFEDAGYFCVDNLPPEMIASLAELFAHEGSKVERAAVVCDVRGGNFTRVASAVGEGSIAVAFVHQVLHQ